MKVSKYRFVIIASVILVQSFAQATFANDIAAEPKTTFVQTNKIEGDEKVILKINQADSTVSLANGNPQVRMKIENIQDLMIKQSDKGMVRMDVFRTTFARELVAVYTYRVKRKHKTLKIRVNLPEFENQSENFEFVVYDTEGNARAKFQYSFFARELVEFNQDFTTIEESEEPLFSEEELEFLAKTFTIAKVRPREPAGIEKKNGKYTFNVPDGSGVSGSMAKKLTNKAIVFRADGVGTLAERDEYDAEKKGFIFLDEETGDAYFKKTRKPGDWSLPVPVRGPEGPQGEQGEAGNGDTFFVEDFDPAKIANGAIDPSKIKSHIEHKALILPLKDALRKGKAMFGSVANGSVPVIRFFSGSSAGWSFFVPTDLHRTSAANPNVRVKILWSPSNNLGNDVDWEFSYSSYNETEVLSDSEVTQIIETVTSPSQTLETIETVFEIPISELKEVLFLKLKRIDANDVRANIGAITLEYPDLTLDK